MKNEPVAWTACLDCGQRVTSDSIHTCSPQLKTLTDEELYEFTHRMIICSGQNPNAADINIFGLTRIVEDILKKAQER